MGGAVVTSELRSRPPSPPNYQAESLAYAELARETARSEESLLQRLAELAQTLCGAQSAGISIREAAAGGLRFRWRAIVGAWAAFKDVALPAEQAPCAAVLETDGPLLLARPAEYCEMPEGLDPPIHEALAVPFRVEGEAVGALWAIAHDPSGGFDAEHERLLTSLSDFASTGFQMIALRERQAEELAERRAAEQRLRESEARLREAIARLEEEQRQTERKARAIREAERAFLEQSELLEAIFDNIPVLLCIWDPRLERFRFNAHFTQTLGWTEADTQDCEFMLKAYPDAESRKKVSDFMLSLEKGFRDFRTATKGGEFVDVAWANVQLSNEVRVGIGVDIRERRRAEKALREHRRQLEKQNQQLAEEIGERRRAEAALLEADRRKDEFLATLAHELRNPLAPIRTGVELLKRVARDPVALEETRRAMERQTRQLIALVDDLMDVSRITRGKLELRKRPVALAEIARTAIEASRPFIDEARHELLVELGTEEMVIEADPIRIAQVLSNLLNNAAKYTPAGGRLKLRAERQSEWLHLAVEDNGVGLPGEMLERIFEMFEQADRPSGIPNPGLGIGLTLVRSIVELHGGRIEAESDGIGRGSRFSVYLPSSEPQGEAPPAPPQPTAVSLAPPRRKVLVVDDNEAAAEMLRLLLTVLGHDAQLACDGEQAVERAQAHRPDAVLMDLGMPRMDGYEAARRLRSQEWGERITLIALTGWGQVEDRRRTREAGFDYHLVKPADPEELQRLLALRRAP